MDVQPSVVAADGDRDGIPNVLLEAMASGLPVVSTPVSGIPEVLNDRNSELVAPGDPGAIAATIGRLAADETRRMEVIRNARETFYSSIWTSISVFCYLCLAVVSVWNMPVRMSQPEAGANILQATGGWRYRCTAMMSGNEDCLLIIDYPYVGAIMWRKV
ncbi:MAG: glycosyltransferase family 4 protein [Alistipes indistinctus]